MELFTTKKNYQVRALDFDLKFEVVQIVLLHCDKLNLEGPTNLHYCGTWTPSVQPSNTTPLRIGKLILLKFNT